MTTEIRDGLPDETCLPLLELRCGLAALRVIERHPDVMATGNIGHKPNDALFHAEANALLRAAEPYGGSLAGRTVEMRVDRELCRSCEFVLPSMGTQIGNPTVRIIDGTGAVWIMRDGTWIRRGRP